MLPREELERMYVAEQRPILQIARHFRVRNGTVIDAAKAYGFHRPQSYVSEEWLREHYVARQETIEQLCATLDCGEANIRKYLRLYHIPIRYKSRGSPRVPPLNDRAWLHEQYITLGLSSNVIARQIGARGNNVLRALHKFGIPVRQMSRFKREGRGYYHNAFSPKQCEAIKKRDGYRCRECGATDDLQCHHIIPVRSGGVNHVPNGITLCRTCHDRTRGHESELISYYQSLPATHQEPPA